MEFTIQKIQEHIYALDQGGVRSFLLVGPEDAILVDTCFGGDILSVCRSITPNPITLVTTHSDGDHTGCDHQFPRQYLHSTEFDRYESRNKSHAVPMAEGDVFTVGQNRLEVLWIPGHTPGSVALLDRERRFLISGDTVQNGCIYMFGEGRNLTDFRASLARLEALRREGLFDRVLPAHGDAVVDADILPDLLALTDEVLSGTAVPAEAAPARFPDGVKVYCHGRAQMYYAY